MPRCILLVSVGRAEYSFLVEPIRHYLQAYGQHILGEPTGNGNGRDAGDGSGRRKGEIPYLIKGLGLGCQGFLGFINPRRRGSLIWCQQYIAGHTLARYKASSGNPIETYGIPGQPILGEPTGNGNGRAFTPRGEVRRGRSNPSLRGHGRELGGGINPDHPVKRSS